MTKSIAAAVLATVLAVPVPSDAMQLWHRETWDGYRAASLTFDPWVCGLWVADETPVLPLLSPTGREIPKLETPLTKVRAIAADADGLLVTNG